MITLHTPRQYVETFILTFFPFIDMWKKTQINNLVGEKAQSDRYLSAVAINCIIDELQNKFRKKILNCKGADLRIELSPAQGVILYKLLFNIPYDSEKPHFVAIFTSWIQLLDGQIITHKIYEENKIASVNAASSYHDYFE